MNKNIDHKMPVEFLSSRVISCMYVLEATPLNHECVSYCGIYFYCPRVKAENRGVHRRSDLVTWIHKYKIV